LTTAQLSSLTTARPASGTYLPTNLNPTGDKDAIPNSGAAEALRALRFFRFSMAIPRTAYGNFLFSMNTLPARDPSVGGWTINITTQLASPLSAVSRKMHGNRRPTFDVDSSNHWHAGR